MAAALLAGACWDGAEPDQTELPGFVSNPLLGVGAAAGSASAPSLAGGSSVAWVSLPSDSVPGGQLATIRNSRTGDIVTAPMLDGGFDPVAIAAVVGDTVDIEVRRGGTDAPVRLVGLVPRLARPRVVRTNPPPKKRDVVLDVRPFIVFTEPVDPTTLTAESVRLWRWVGSYRLAVSGRVEVGDGEGLTATFVPAQALADNATYELTLSSAILDLDGAPLVGPVSVQFATGSQAAGEVALAGQVAFVSWTSSLRSMLGDGSLARTLVDSIAVTSPDGWSRPSFSPDGARIAFGGAWDIYTVGTDGSGLVKLTNDGSDFDPAWSPDGSEIVFASRRGASDSLDSTSSDLWLMNADGSGLTRLTNDDGLTVYDQVARAYDRRPTWSPDGKKVAFERWLVSYNGTDSVWGWNSPQIWVVGVDGSGLTNLTPGWSDNFSEPAWSPDGSQIAVHCVGGVACVPGGIWVMNTDGAGRTGLTSQSQDRDPAWTGDGRIMFTRFLPVGPSASTSKLFIMNADGSGIRMLTQPEGDNHGPAWGSARVP